MEVIKKMFAFEGGNDSEDNNPQFGRTQSKNISEGDDDESPDKKKSTKRKIIHKSQNDKKYKPA